MTSPTLVDLARAYRDAERLAQATADGVEALQRRLDKAVDEASGFRDHLISAALNGRPELVYASAGRSTVLFAEMEHLLQQIAKAKCRADQASTAMAVAGEQFLNYVASVANGTAVKS